MIPLRCVRVCVWVRSVCVFTEEYEREGEQTTERGFGIYLQLISLVPWLTYCVQGHVYFMRDGFL